MTFGLSSSRLSGAPHRDTAGVSLPLPVPCASNARRLRPSTLIVKMTLAARRGPCQLDETLFHRSMLMVRALMSNSRLARAGSDPPESPAGKVICATLDGDLGAPVTVPICRFLDALYSVTFQPSEPRSSRELFARLLNARSLTRVRAPSAKSLPASMAKLGDSGAVAGSAHASASAGAKARIDFQAREAAVFTDTSQCAVRYGSPTSVESPDGESVASSL